MSLYKNEGYLDVYLKEPAVTQNRFRLKSPQFSRIPSFSSARPLLPKPFWEGHDDSIDCWWKAWEIAFNNIRPANSATGFIAPFIDSAFNECLFMWDSVFIMQFTRYAIHAFDFIQTLDNFYSKQHEDGFICREIKEWDGKDRFHRFDPASTGPNVLTFAEWQHFQFSGNKDRLSEVFPALLAYHRWMRKYRTWPDGSYWSTGWGSGMDNQPRTVNPEEWIFYHDHLTWVDATIQALLSAQIILRIVKTLNISTTSIIDIIEEQQFLYKYITNNLWDSETEFFKDRNYSGTLSPVKTIGAFWALHIDNLPHQQIKALTNALENTFTFNRPHRVPSLSADDPHYNPQGGYWHGSVWPSTNYMVISGLEYTKNSELARSIATNHYNCILEVFRKTGTFWENYSPEEFLQGDKAKKDFVGWAGIGPIALFLEYIFGLRSNKLDNVIHWNVNLIDNHGIIDYPFGENGLVNLECKQRQSIHEHPVVKITANIPITVLIRWPGGSDIIHLHQE